ncbi:hypothetical protein GQX74_010740 [Glossina fuscipes]|nr:hypothetical protein GQX74_010740 [Glossina fuscipes]
MALLNVVVEDLLPVKHLQNILPTDRKLKEHLKYSHDPQSSVICDKCGKTLKSGCSLKKHNEIEHSDKPKPPPEPQQCYLMFTLCLNDELRADNTLNKTLNQISNKCTSNLRESSSNFGPFILSAVMLELLH